MNIINYTNRKKGIDYLPTPAPMIKKMLDCVDWRKINTILEPSAGEGAILKSIARENLAKHFRIDDIDCIELDADLRKALEYNFSDEAKGEIEMRKTEIARKYGCIDIYRDSGLYFYADEKGFRITLPADDQNKLDELDVELTCFFDSGIHIVHDDFLTFQDYKRYDLIIMVPPKSEGSKHLLKALNMQKNGGCVVCLLGEATLKNPQTEEDKQVSELLTKYSANIEYINQMAIIKVDIPDNDNEPSLFDIYAKEKGYTMTSEQPISLDSIQESIIRYQSEIEAGIELIKSYKRMRPYLTSTFDKTKAHFEDPPILALTNGVTGCGSKIATINTYIKSVRCKYWMALLTNPSFLNKLTSNLQRKYRDKVYSFSDYDFSEFNIRRLIDEINCQTKSDIKDEILEEFDFLTNDDKIFTECAENKNSFSGWGASKAWKIGKKSIIPCQVFGVYNDRPQSYKADPLLTDIERFLNFFRGNASKISAEIDVEQRLDESFRNGNTKNVTCRFFNVTFYKKGTMHITFTCPELIDRFNIYVARCRGWLPPSYGKKQYKDLTKEEKEVIDSFQGKESYNKVLASPDIYLASPTDNFEQINPFTSKID